MRRFIRCCPLMLVCLLFIGSIAAVGYVSLLLPDKLVLTRSLLIIAGGVTAAAGLILCAVSGRGEGRAALIFFGAAIAVGCVIGSLYFGDYRNRIVQSFSGSDRSVTAVVGRVRYSSASYMIFDAQLSSIDGENCSLSATVKVRGASGLRVGERFGMHADIAETEPYDGTALSLMYSASEGRFLTLSTDSLRIYGREPSGSLTARFARLRERVGQTLSLRLGDGAGLCRALLLGDRSELGDSISDDFSALGISHIVAVSGLHLGIITAVVSFLLRRLHVPNAPSIIVTAVFALLFAALTGFSSSVLRSALMLLIASSARLGGRSGHMPTSLASAVALIILFRPCAVLDVGLVLSFSSTFGIAVIGAPLCRRISERISRYTHDIRERFYSRSPSAMRGAISGLAVGMAEFALDSVIIGASANLLTAPLAFLFFGFSSLYSIPATVLFSPLAGLLLSLSPFALLPSSFVLTPYAASVVASISNFVSRLASACAVLAYEMGPFGALAVTGMLLYGLPFILRGLPSVAYGSDSRRRRALLETLSLGMLLLVGGIAAVMLLASAGAGTAPSTL